MPKGTTSLVVGLAARFLSSPDATFFGVEVTHVEALLPCPIITARQKGFQMFALGQAVWNPRVLFVHFVLPRSVLPWTHKRSGLQGKDQFNVLMCDEEKESKCTNSVDPST